MFQSRVVEDGVGVVASEELARVVEAWRVCVLVLLERPVGVCLDVVRDARLGCDFAMSACDVALHRETDVLKDRAAVQVVFWPRRRPNRTGSEVTIVVHSMDGGLRDRLLAASDALTAAMMNCCPGQSQNNGSTLVNLLVQVLHMSQARSD